MQQGKRLFRRMWWLETFHAHRSILLRNLGRSRITLSAPIAALIEALTRARLYNGVPARHCKVAFLLRLSVSRRRQAFTEVLVNDWSAGLSLHYSGDWRSSRCQLGRRSLSGALHNHLHARFNAPVKTNELVWGIHYSGGERSVPKSSTMKNVNPGAAPGTRAPEIEARGLCRRLCRGRSCNHDGVIPRGPSH